MSSDYYQFAFAKTAEVLPQVLFDYAQLNEQQRSEQNTKQPADSPTMMARRLAREDGFIPWKALRSTDQNLTLENNELLTTVSQQLHSWPATVVNAARAFSPWPSVWTIVPTPKGEKRMKILGVKIENNRIILEKVQLEGLQPTSFQEIKNQISK